VDWLPIAIVITLAMVFNYTNGFHDAANAIATSISTRALTPRIALLLAAIFNLVGAFFGAKVAKTVGSGIIGAPDGNRGLTLVAAALLGAIGWNLLTWWKGLPSSSSHALIGGLGGAAIAASATVHWHVVLEKIVIPMVVSPIAGVLIGYLVMTTILWTFRGANPGKVSRGFRYAQSLSACAMALGHGLQDAAKTAGVVVLALNVGGHTGSPRRRQQPRSCTSPVSASGPRSRQPTRSPPPSWASARPSGSQRFAGAWPATSSAPGS
jgi:PiT family inorganic phosphate transporter